MSNNKTKKVIKTKLTDKNGKMPTGKLAEKLKVGDCVFPFIYNGNTYNECFKGKNGDWCATKVNKEGKMKRMAYCDYGDNKATKKASNNRASNNTKTSTKKNNASKPKSGLVIKSQKKKVFTTYKDVDISGLDMKKLGIPNKSSVTPKMWELPNRKVFGNWFDKTYTKYRAKKGAIKSVGNTFDFFPHQKLIRDYLQIDSPYRGILLYHGLGVGKTCASIAISEGFRSNRKIIVLLNKSLKQNFRGNLMFCGYEYFRTNQHWFYHEFTESDPMRTYAKMVGVSNKFIRKHNGAWFIDFTKKPNFEELSIRQQSLLEEQINYMIDDRYTFLHMDGLTKKKLEKYVEDRIFDDALLIVDEVHNLTNAMAKVSQGVRAKNLERLIMNASNLKLVFLSGTPMINNLYEVAKLFNLLRGYIITYNFTLRQIGSKSKSALFKNLETVLNNHPLVDQCFIKEKENFVRVVRNPHGFVSDNRGVYRPTDAEIKKLGIDPNMDQASFIALLNDILKQNDFNSSYMINKYLALPDDEEELMNLFYDDVNNKIKNPDLFKSRILGLVSFYKTQDKSLLPTVTLDSLVKVPMSDYQFLQYSKVRKDEIEQDKNKKSSKPKKKKKTPSEEAKGGPSDNVFEAKSSYRAYSRMHCSFVFPETIPRPYPSALFLEEGLSRMSNGLKQEAIKEILTKVEEALDRDDIVDNIDEQFKLKNEEKDKTVVKRIMKKYEKAKDDTLKQLLSESDSYLIQGEKEKLIKYSSKYNTILENINKLTSSTGKNLGTAFVYTEYKTLEGIAVLSVVLRANGYAPFVLDKNPAGEYIMNVEYMDDIGKPKYAFWGGDEEESDIIRKIYNNDFDDLPKSLQDQFKELKLNNLRGDIIKVLMTTKSGAEGIDLHNVRQVHVTEPYWNPVRIKQVKGRAVRVGSHLQLPPSDRTVEIYTYLSVATKQQLKDDKTIAQDKDGMTSDEVLFDISGRKLKVMDHLLQLIKESSVDCALNYEETFDKDTDNFKCSNYGTGLSRDIYAYVPNLKEEHIDKEKKRRVTTITWKPKKVTLKGKDYAMKPAEKAGNNIALYDYESTIAGRPGNPIGKIVTKDGKKKAIFYK